MSDTIYCCVPQCNDEAILFHQHYLWKYPEAVCEKHKRLKILIEGPDEQWKNFTKEEFICIIVLND